MKNIQWFITNFSTLVDDMKNSNHHIGGGILSNFHAEGDVFTHTMMVYSHVDQTNTELQLAALLHDIAKPESRILKENKVEPSFSFHEHTSMFKSIDILNKYEQDFPDETIDKIKILKAINWHQLLHKIGTFDDEQFILSSEEIQWLNHFFGPDLEMYDFLVQLGTADTKGRIAKDILLMNKRYEYLSSFIPQEMFHVKDNKPIAYILCGTPCSGKSTYAQELMKNTKFNYISLDNIITKNGTVAYNMAYNKKNIEKGVDTLYSELKDAVKNNENIILDMVNTDPKDRLKKSKLIRAWRY